MLARLAVHGRIRHAVKDNVQTPPRTHVPDALDAVDARIPTWNFSPYPRLRNGHLQTFAGAFWRRSFKNDLAAAEQRLVEVEPGCQILLRCNWLPERRSRPTALIVHGLEGSDASGYMMGTADKFLSAGWNAVRMNMRNCGGTEHLSRTLYHSGMSGDVATAARFLADTEGLDQIALVGFSLGGNSVLKLVGQLGDDVPSYLLGAAAVSAAADLTASADRLEHPSNWVYHGRFVRSLHQRMRRKHALFPELYDISQLRGLRTVRAYDNRYIAPLFGFRDAEDYYETCSAAQFLDAVRVPTLVLHALDDPFIPLTDRIRTPALNNPFIRLVATERGGHVGFVASDIRPQNEDRQWAENRLVEFLECLTYNPDRSHEVNPTQSLVPY